MRIPYSKGLEIYGKSPPLVQSIFALFLMPIPRSVMLGSGFHTFFRELTRTQWYKPERLKRFQESRLRALIRHAYHKVPYYHRIFRERNIRYDDVRTIKDLEKIPILTKDDVRNHFSELVAVNAREYRYGIGRTSGSTGKPLTFYLDQQNREIEYATQWRQRRWANIHFNSKIATFRPFRGNLGWINFQSGKPRWKFNAFSKQLEFNVFGIDKTTLKMYVNRLTKFCPGLIEGFPSTIELLAKYILEHNIKGVSPAAVQTSSEKLSDHQRAVIKEAFDCRVYDWYGQSEYVVSAGECPEGNYHIVESGIMEFIKDGEQISEGEIGEIIGTGLYNYSMPFIRYRTTDLGRYSEEKCSCGRGLPIIRSLEGRVSDLIIAPDGKLISGASFEHYWKHQISPHAPNLDYVHVIQKSNKKLLIEIVKKEGYSDKETQALLRGLILLLGPEVQIELKDLGSIPNGRKWRFTESELDISLL